MKPVVYLSIFLIGLHVQCHHVPGHHHDQDDHGDENTIKHYHGNGNETLACHKISPSNANFALRLYKEVASGVAAKNVFISPLSISTAFALLTLGAKSDTLHQIYEALTFNLSETEEQEIHEGFHHLIHMLNSPNNTEQVNVGNALFVAKSLKLLPKFLEDAKTLYDAKGFPADFNSPAVAEKQINDYVKNKTHGKIAQAVDKLDPSVVMVLVNYIFFKAYWEEPFDSHSISEQDFFVDANTTVKVNMMSRRGRYNIFYDKDLSCWVVDVPYKGNTVAIFILPDQGKMKEVEGALEKEMFLKWAKSMKSEKIQLSIPKFSMTASYDLKDLLQRLGMTDVFSENADLSGITGEGNLQVSKVVHKAVVDVHESGTEAAAVTVVQVSRLALQFPPPLQIRFNRPFLVAILDSATKSFPFLGKIADPTEK